MYRSRLGGDLEDVTLEYVSSMQDDSEIVQYDILGSQAHVLMLHENGLLNKSDAKKILRALESLKNIKLDGMSGAEDVHELVESLVIKKAGAKSGGRMHTARSRNDQVALDTRMKIRDDIIILCRLLLDNIEALVSLAQAHKRTIMPLYTHMQQAQAGLFSHYLLALADALFRDADRLHSAFGRVNQSPLGAGPVGGTGLPIDRHYTASLLGFDGIVENSLDATSGRDFAAEYVSAVAILMANLSRTAEDFVVWSTAEFSFIEIADELASPSSVMPQKKNPDIMELTRGKAALVAGNLSTVLGASKGLASGYGRDLQQVKPAVWSTSRTAIGALAVMRSVLLTIQVNKARMKKSAKSGYLEALDAAEALVLKGVPFRTAHRVVGMLVQAAHERKVRLGRLDADTISRAATETGTDAETVMEAVGNASIDGSLRNRTSAGSSGYGEQDRMIADRISMVQSGRERLAQLEDAVSSSLDGLSARVRAVSG